MKEIKKILNAPHLRMTPHDKEFYLNFVLIAGFMALAYFLSFG